MLKNTPWSSGVNLGTMFVSAQAEKNEEGKGAGANKSKENKNAEIAEIERQMEELTFGPKQAPSAKPASSSTPYASPALARFFPSSSSSSSSSSTTTTTTSSSSAPVQNNQRTKNLKELAKFHTNMLRKQKARYKLMNFPGYMEEMYPEAHKLQYNRNQRNLVKYEPYMNEKTKEEFKNNIAAAKQYLSTTEAQRITAQKARNEFTATRISQNLLRAAQQKARNKMYGRTYRKNRKTRKSTRKNRK